MWREVVTRLRAVEHGELVVLLVATVAAAHNVEVLDDCVPNADWGVNGCLLDAGDVTRSEFNAELLYHRSTKNVQVWRFFEAVVAWRATGAPTLERRNF